MNKMQRPEQEITRYGAEDVIATSGGGIIPSSTPQIWLDKNSVINFNDYNKGGDINLQITDNYSYEYYAYNGNIFPFGFEDGNWIPGGSSFTQIDQTNERPETFTTMKANDGKQYQIILDWLKSKI